MGLKCQFIIKIDTQKVFTFIVEDGNFTNVDLNFLYRDCKKIRGCDFSRFAFRRLSVNYLNKVFEIFVLPYSNLC